jgi:hypothetical protein
VKCTIPVVTNSVISRAINAGVKTGECFEISLSDYGIDFIGRRRTKSFVREWWHCFEDETRKPSKHKAYLAVGFSFGEGNCGAFLVEI